MAMRVGDQERERAVAALRKQFADGHLSLEEFGDRVELAYAAVTVDDLNTCLADLPQPVAPIVTATPARPPRPGLPPAAHAGRVARATKAGPPAISPDRAKRIARKSFYAHLGPYVVVNAFLVMLWVVTSFGNYFWPIWPMMGWGIALGIHAWGAFVVAGRD